MYVSWWFEYSCQGKLNVREAGFDSAASHPIYTIFTNPRLLVPVSHKCTTTSMSVLHKSGLSISKRSLPREAHESSQARVTAPPVILHLSGGCHEAS